MPRPGPRPYECVRRAWHSDRHNPIRGSLIQEIFRIANEVHSPSTRNNREWQEKLPIVVLRAEEILYSKASSEAEYTDLTTLWDRVNDALDTIIRKDESTETGALLQPCIEAALHLGCTPRRSSRSQRNDSPRCYLRHDTLEPVPVLTSNSDETAFKNSLISHLKAANCRVPSKNFLGTSKEFASIREHHHVQEPSCSLSRNWSVYPLHYNINNDTQLDGSKISSSRQNFLTSEVALNSSLPNQEHMVGIGLEVNCDLTLRLGPVVHSCASVEDDRAPQVKPSAFQ